MVVSSPQIIDIIGDKPHRPGRDTRRITESPNPKDLGAIRSRYSLSGWWNIGEIMV